MDYAQTPVLVNGGPQVTEQEFLNRLEAARDASGRGCLVGRNFSGTGHLDKTVRAASLILREGRAANDVFKNSTSAMTRKPNDAQVLTMGARAIAPEAAGL